MLLGKRRRRTLAQELVAPDVGGSFHATRYNTSHWGLHWHAHPELELTLIVRGEGLRYAADGIEEFASGDLVLLGPGVPHSWSSAPRRGTTAEAVVAQFTPDALLGPGWRRHAEFAPLTALFAHAARGLHVTGEAGARAGEDLLALAGHPPGPLRTGLLLTALGRIAAASAGEVRPLARHVPTGPLADADGAWGRMLRHLHEHADGELSISALAARLGLSPASFSRGFRRRFGTTCGDYLARVRLARVGRELVEGERSIADIAFSAGFANLANFNRRFRALHGTTPREFRRRHRPG